LSSPRQIDGRIPVEEAYWQKDDPAGRDRLILVQNFFEELRQVVPD
jgi:hypothetical protein